MNFSYFQISSTGPVRSKNEDYCRLFQPLSKTEYRQRGVAMLLADGVGGHGRGDEASHLAVDAAFDVFCELPLETAPRRMLWKMFNAANLAVYDAGMQSAGSNSKRRPSTTLTISIVRNGELTVGHVGDCRAYLLHGNEIRQLTADHSYAAQQLKLGLISAEEAAASDMRCVLLRSLGKDPVIQFDVATAIVYPGDWLVQCCDGVHHCLAERELHDIVTHAPTDLACRQLVALAEKRGSDDNLSVQILQVPAVERVRYYRGAIIYEEKTQAPMNHELEVGHLLDGRFQINDVISRSGMASIFRAKDLKTDEEVAIKVPFMQFESDPAFHSRFEREEAIGKSLHHPDILRVIPVEEQKSRPYIVMELLSGQTLRAVLDTVRRVPVGEALDIASHICDGLSYLHQHEIVHRDLKPENIMICDDGSTRIMDFGIAKSAAMRRLTYSGLSSAMGTPDYMAPEQVKGKRGDAKTDVYALGAILYEMITGRPPFEGANPYQIMNARLVSDPIAPRKIDPGISPQVEEIVLHALEQNPNNRYESAAAMKAELESPETVVITDRVHHLRPPALWKSTGRKIAMYVILALIPVIAFVGLYFAFNNPWRKH